ncbi:MAG: LapA family protein [Xanthobacteraceae bacterium]
MRKVVNILVVVPLAAIFVVFAVANRRLVTVSFDPFNSNDPSIGVTLPLFVVLIVVAILGVVAGSVASWLRHRRWRGEARRFEAEMRETRAELALLREQTREATAPPALPYHGAPAVARDNPAPLL